MCNASFASSSEACAEWICISPSGPVHTIVCGESTNAGGSVLVYMCAVCDNDSDILGVVEREDLA
jgi:hypothetical protein